MKDNQFTQKSTIINPITNEEPKSIVLFGAESSGKSTLTKELANYYNVFSNPEFSRLYLDTKMKYANYEDTNALTFDDVEPIAIGQICSENSTKELAISHNHSFYFLDTNLLTTYIYSRFIYKNVPFWLEKAIQNQNYSHYLLLKPNTKWEFDKQRASDEGRQFFYKKMKEELEKRNINYSEITELNEKRLQEAIKRIDFLF
ncbi:putative ATPase/kinase involved in NAD metabolism [Bernardetia litoralis DSM 6794]|uniref:Putative ATPase/kinase involved in NAD metabolism n=1 Tax=Bernardetia litoralis (strain ATCC 23117 / DSM 6794 / NBRC 15988 / NCIMB 1366 / Fx l1 / Sio-4) TaxID=880071 RepID=I4AQL9_BERLS|nr:ATP-binding protein [Bernardetia litoralis]AFM06254.1 putative ATPase/kinase involved in NAD metabolism [Bernardetia litoralis DSM 6794]